MRVSFFGNDGSFDPIIPVIDFEREDVQAVGEQESIFSLVTSGFSNEICLTTKPLTVIVRQQDEPLCNSDCGYGPSNLAAQTVEFFPDARPFIPIVIQNTGHFLNLHFFAQETFEKAHDWLGEGGILKRVARVKKDSATKMTRGSVVNGSVKYNIASIRN
jgi:hypothetical protein